MVGVVTREQSGILNEHGHSFQDKRDEELDVNQVPGTTQSPEKKTNNNIKTAFQVINVLMHKKCGIKW